MKAPRAHGTSGAGFAVPLARLAGKLLVACLLPALIPGCASLPGPRPVPASLLQEDPFDASYKVHCDSASGKTVCVMTGNALRPFNPRYPLLSLGAVSEADKSGAQSFSLRVVYANEKRWLTIPGGATLRVTVDGEPSDVEGVGSAGGRYTGDGGKVYEVALYPVPSALLRRIATGRAVAVSLRGDFVLEKSFGNINTLYFQQFVRHYVDKAPKSGN
jgi:hypothetical protein